MVEDVTASGRGQMTAAADTDGRTLARIRTGLWTGVVVGVLAVILGGVNVFFDSPVFGWTLVDAGVALLLVIPVLGVILRWQAR